MTGDAVEKLLREYKEAGTPGLLRRVLRKYEEYLPSIARRYARFSATRLHREEDLHAIAQQEVYFSLQAYEFRCPTCAEQRFLSYAGLQGHGRAEHGSTAERPLEPKTRLDAFVYWRVGRALQRVLDRERALSRAADRYDKRHEGDGGASYRGQGVPGRFRTGDAGPDLLDRLSHGCPERGMLFALDVLEAVRREEGQLEARDRDVLQHLLIEEENAEVARVIAGPHRLRETSARVIVSRLRERARKGEVLPRLRVAAT